MKMLVAILSRFSRTKAAGDDFFDTRLTRMGKPQPTSRPTRAPRPVLFRRMAAQ